MTDALLAIALSKGRTSEETLPLSTAAGIVPAEEPEKSRKLIIGTSHDNIRLVIVRAAGVLIYVQHGVADFGIVGKDVLIKHSGGGSYQPLDLYIASCRMMVAVKKGFDHAAASQFGSCLWVATRYPDTTVEHSAGKGMHVDIIKLYGSMELAPLVGLSNAIADPASSDNTSKANGLKAVKHVADIPSRLVVNKTALKIKYALLDPTTQALENAAKAV